MKQTVQLKPDSRGWFAAGAGFERALGALSDAAFKVFVHVCLRADGCLEFERAGLSRELGKSRSTPGRCLRELEAKRICEVEAACHSQLRRRRSPHTGPARGIRVAHASAVLVDVVGALGGFLAGVCVAAQRGEQAVEAALLEVVAAGFGPRVNQGFVGGEERFGRFPKFLLRMPEIDNLDRAGVILVGNSRWSKP
ncbi:MAG: hypothetical protein OXJ37_11730 [Bryobacterales bacterium]|nr:hypothetical protein [Bryobacterales bacterium]